MSLSGNMREQSVIHLWQQLARSRPVLTIEGNEQIKIIYPGRINHSQGADFCDAVVATRCGVLKGDIEVHTRFSDWRGHQHHHNPNYNRVILHVVLKRHQASTKVNHGGYIPMVVLDKYLNGSMAEDPPHKTLLHNTASMACDSGSRSTDAMTQFLDSAGDVRFLAKADRFRVSITQMEPGQALYQEMMVALGYSQNKLPFLELAQRLPLRTLESVVPPDISDEEYLWRQQARLLGTAGLLPSQRHYRLEGDESETQWPGTLEKLWASCPPTEAMPTSAWNLFRVRPNNSPVRRLIAMGYLLLRYREIGLLSGMVNIIEKAPVSQGYHELAAGLTVTVPGYWASHLDFGATTRLANPYLVGRSRAADIVVNVLLPFAFAWGQLHSNTELEGKSLALYHHHPRLVSNSVERHMITQLRLNSNLVNSAQRQQGLLHIYRTLCTQGKCDTCPLAVAT